MNVRIVDTAEDVAAAAAERVAHAVTARPGVVLGLPTGRTPVATYAALRQKTLDWSRVRTFNLDELVGVAAADPRSYRSFMHEHLFDAVNLPPAHVQFLDGTASDLAAECRRYEAAIAAAGGIDLLLCGVGLNGHLAFNEPGPSLVARTHVESLHAATREANAGAFGGRVSAVPDRALTIGMGTLLGARRILLLATGAAKAGVVAAALRGPLTTELPASWLQVHPAVDVLLDREAAGAVAP